MLIVLMSRSKIDVEKKVSNFSITLNENLIFMNIYINIFW